MAYPVMKVHKNKIRDNARKIAELCAGKGIDVWGVSKGLAGDPRLAALYAEAGFAGVADSRLLNLKKIRDAANPLPRQLMRIAMPSELQDLPEIATISLQSEVSTILELDRICVKKGLSHEILLMLDVGDLREGFWSKELPELGDKLAGLHGGVRITGVATNFACASGVLPTREKLEDLLLYRDTAQKALGFPLPNISVGGTCCLKAVEEGIVPDGINQIRACEGILLGRDTAYMREIPYLDQSTIVITAEIVECKHKPSVPSGEIGMQAFGEKPVFIDRGMRKRALVAIGRQDVNIDRLKPLERGVHIITASSDHMILDVTEADSMKHPDAGYKPGDTLSFSPLYPAVLAAATSEYVEVRFES